MTRQRDQKGRFLSGSSAPAKTAIRRPAKRTVKVETGGGTYTAMGYHSARVASRDGWGGVSGAAASQHMQYDRIMLIGQSRQFMRDNGIYNGMIGRANGYIVGNGFRLQAKTGDPDLDKKIEKLWKKFWKRPEIKGVLTGARVERMVCRELLVAGDTAAIKTSLGLLQLIEAEQITGGRRGVPKDGITKNKYNGPVSMYIGPYSRNGSVDGSRSKPYRFNEHILYLTDPERPSGLRAVPPCQSTFPMLHRINDVCDSEAIAWQMLARIAVSITRPGGPSLGNEESKEDTTKTDTDGEMATRITELDNALIFHGEPGDEIKGIERNIPGSNFSESLIMFLRLLGLPLGLPLEVILLDWTKSNYSQSRAVLVQAYQTFLGWQELLEGFFHTPVYEWKIQSWIDEGLIEETEKVTDLFNHDWIKPTFPWLDQLKEAQAHGAKLDRGLTTQRIVCKSLNLDADEVRIARGEEIVAAIKLAKEIEEKTEVKVPWQPLAGLKVPKSDGGRPAGEYPNDEAGKDKSV